MGKCSGHDQLQRSNGYGVIQLVTTKGFRVRVCVCVSVCVSAVRIHPSLPPPPCQPRPPPRYFPNHPTQNISYNETDHTITFGAGNAHKDVYAFLADRKRFAVGGTWAYVCPAGCLR